MIEYVKLLGNHLMQFDDSNSLKSFLTLVHFFSPESTLKSDGNYKQIDVIFFF